MRTLAILAILALAAPAAAQPYRDLMQARDAQAFADAQAARARDITQTNELANLQARLQSDQAIANLQSQRSAQPPPVLAGTHAVPPVVDARKLVSIPDAALAQSNARIRAASEPR